MRAIRRPAKSGGKRKLRRQANLKAGDKFTQDASNVKGEDRQTYIKRLKVMELHRRVATKRLQERQATTPLPSTAPVQPADKDREEEEEDEEMADYADDEDDGRE